MNTACRVKDEEDQHDLAHTRRDKDAELTLQVAKQNSDFDQAVQKILKQRMTLQNIHEHIDFYASGPRSELIEREQLGQAVFDKDWPTVNQIMQDVFEVFIAWETLHIQNDLENEPRLIEEALK
jgi:hypothetical protein